MSIISALDQLASELRHAENTARAIMTTEVEFPQSVHSVFLKIRHAQAELDVLRIVASRVVP